MLKNIRNTVLNGLSNSCQCQITAENIDQEQLGCSDLHALLNYVTYQAQLICNLEKNSSLHISAGVCSVFSAQNDTRECPSTNTGAIVQS